MKTYQSILPEIQLKYKTGTIQKVCLKCSNDAANYFRQLFDADLIEYREEMILLLLNQANNTLGFIKISSGGITGTVCDPRMIFASALTSGATSIMVSHNHPSGSLKPSQQDIELTKTLVAGGKLLNIKVLDHIIVTNSGYYSFADEGLIN